MRTNLKVPFAEKEEAKKLGARWDAARKIWYVDDKADLTPFAKWAPSSHDGAVASNGAKKSISAKDQSPGFVIAGANYKPQPRVCECLPWDDCDKCRAAA